MTALLHTTDKEEAVSRVYASALAAKAGFVEANRSLDRDGIDIQLLGGGHMFPKLDIQLKATINLGDAKNGYFSFPLKRNNYELLRAESLVPRILVVLELPKDESEWIYCDVDSIVLRRRAFWASLKGMPETLNSSSVTVQISEQNRFDYDGLRDLMEYARTGQVI